MRCRGRDLAREYGEHGRVRLHRVDIEPAGDEGRGELPGAGPDVGNAGRGGRSEPGDRVVGIARPPAVVLVCHLAEREGARAVD